ncbi:hypothetical protein Pelo_5429 [Pelomyxa schiedti]|nr:hypothetical protein Pelo_5429 [Pelomyxa schiedti]
MAATETTEYTVPGEFDNRLSSGRRGLVPEILFMCRWVVASSDVMRRWCEHATVSATQTTSAAVDVDATTPTVPELQSFSHNLDLVLAAFRSHGMTISEALIGEIQKPLLSVISTYNRHHRLHVSDKVTLTDLANREQLYSPLLLLPPPLPSEYVDDSVWQQGLPDDKNAWLGHGYYWKFGDGEMNKDLSFSDFDVFEDRFARLKQSRVLLADYTLLRHDFPQCSRLSDTQLDEWLLHQTGYISEGQISRMSPGGDMYPLLDLGPDGIQAWVDTTQRKFALRQKGGGRAATFLVDSKYYFDSLTGEPHTHGMIDVKGVGTTNLQPSFELKANGFLPLTDALKEYAYQKMIQHLCDKERSTCKTVEYYAIIDCGFGFSRNTPNPATGFCGDRCVLLLRQRQSRCVSSYDEVVFYSVVRKPNMMHGIGVEVRRVLTKYGVSSEQSPRSLFLQGGVDIGDLEGDWNMQADAPLTHILDFSHFYILPSSPLPDVWKMSERALGLALQLGCKHLGVFQHPHLSQIAFGVSDCLQAQERFTSLKEQLEQEHGKIGRVGDRKPKHSWSWFLETDDSFVMKWCLEAGAPDHIHLATKLPSLLSGWLSF